MKTSPMQGISYTVKVWLSGFLFTPLIYILLLTLFSGFHFPAPIAPIVTNFAAPYTFLMSIWMALGLFATILLSDHTSIKHGLSITGVLVSFAAILMINSISALQSYGGGYLLALAYAVSTICFVWLYPLNLSGAQSQKTASLAIKDAIIYGLTIWLFTFLLSSPVSISIWIISKDFKSISALKTVQNIVERYNFQLSLSIAYFITIILITLIVTSLNITENKRKAIIFLFAFPINFPVLFYYLLFSRDIYTHELSELLTLILPSIIVSALSIWLIDIVPAAKKKN